MTPSAVAKLVEKWETISKLHGAPDAVRDAVYQQCADELKAVLRVNTDQCCCNVSWLDLDIDDCPIHGPKAKQPQPASGGALSANDVEKFAAELHEVYWQQSITQRDMKGLIPRHHRDYNELSEDIKDYDRALARFVLQRLASHDQKVRREVIVDVLEILVNAICERPEGKSWLVGPGEVWRAIQALAEPAAEKEK